MDVYTARKLATFIAFVSNYSGLLDTYRLVRKHRAGSHVTILGYHRVREPAESPWSLPAVMPENFEKQIRAEQGPLSVRYLPRLKCPTLVDYRPLTNG